MSEPLTVERLQDLLSYDSRPQSLGAMIGWGFEHG